MIHVLLGPLIIFSHLLVNSTPLRRLSGCTPNEAMPPQPSSWFWHRASGSGQAVILFPQRFIIQRDLPVVLDRGEGIVEVMEQGLPLLVLG